MTLAVTHELWKATVRGLEVAGFALSHPEGPGHHVEQTIELTGIASQDHAVKRPNADHLEDLTGFRLVGGGARVDYADGPGSMLTAMFPQNSKTWLARTKDHLEDSPATVRAYCVAARLDEADVHIVTKTSSRPNTVAVAEAVLPSEYQLVGGGARASREDQPNAGTLLTESRPNPKGWSSWIARAKDHEVPSPVEVTAYAIGIRKRTLARHGLKVVHFSATGSIASHAQAKMAMTKGFDGQITCGGAKVEYGSGPGNMLTASWPQRQDVWMALSKDHDVPDPSAIAIAALALAPA